MLKLFGKKNSDIIGLTADELQKAIDFAALPKHIAIIMDGNGRWAKKRAMPRVYGHRAGMKAFKKVVKAAGEIGLKYLTVYAFSTENWKRPESEIKALMDILVEFVDLELEEIYQNNVIIQTLGQIAALPDRVQTALERAKNKTAANTGLILNVCLNYGGRLEITEMVKAIAEKVQAGQLRPEEITAETVAQSLFTAQIPDPDLLIRTSGDYRISNFLLWQMAYAEFYFTPVLWPDFDQTELLRAICSYQQRERRYGGL